MAGWAAFDDSIIRAMVVKSLPAAQQTIDAADLSLLMSTVENIAAGNYIGFGEPEQHLHDAANLLNSLNASNQQLLSVVLLCVAMVGALVGWLKISPEYRARNKVETTFKWMLLGCSLIAILTTVGIVMSVIFESIRFFKEIPITDFLFGLTGAPRWLCAKIKLVHLGRSVQYPCLWVLC